MSILPGLPASRPTPNRRETDRIARLATMATSATAAAVLIHDRAGVYRNPVVADGRIDGAALCAQTASDGVLRVVADDGGVSYMCVPLRAAPDSDEDAVGAICVVDPKARPWTSEQVGGLVDLAEIAAAGLAMREIAAEREQARVDLAREHAFLNGVLEHLTDGVAACDRDGQLVYFNPALREIHGLPERTLTAEDWATAYDLFDANGERPLQPDEIPLARAFAGEEVSNQHMVVRVAGRDPQHFSTTGAPIHDTDGHKLGAVVSMHDITTEYRRRRVRTAHLAVATALADNPGSDEAIATAMLHLRSALEPDTAGVIMTGHLSDGEGTRDGDNYIDRDFDARVVRSVIASGVPRQAPLTAPFAGHVACAPVIVAGTTVGVLYLSGSSRNLLDDLSASIVEGVAGLLGRCLERERAERLDRELRAARHDVERVIRHAQDFVWSVEFAPSGGLSLRTTTPPTAIFGGLVVPDDASWLDLLNDRVYAEDMAEVLQWRDGLLHGRPGEVTCRVRGEDGLVRWVRTRCSVRSEDGRRYVDGVSSDVTGQTRFEVSRGTVLTAAAD